MSEEKKKKGDKKVIDIDVLKGILVNPNVMIRYDQDLFLEDEAKERKVSKAQVVRDIIDEGIKSRG